MFSSLSPCGRGCPSKARAGEGCRGPCAGVLSIGRYPSSGSQRCEPPSPARGEGKTKSCLAHAKATPSRSGGRRTVKRAVDLVAAVLDAGGHVLSFQREDGGAQLRLQIASAKASGALALGMSSRAVEAVAKQYPSMMAKLDGMATAGMIAAPGALLIGDGKGRILGAVGVTGDSGDNDELCARVGIEEVGLMPIG